MAPEKQQPRIFKAEMWRNNWIVSLVGLLAILNVGLIIYMATQLQPVQSSLPVRFTSFANFDRLGSWWQLFFLPFASVLISSFNVFLAQGIYRRSRITSVMLIVASLALTLLAAQIATFFIGVSYGPR